MKIIAIIGSYRKGGNTSRIVKMVAEKMQSAATQLSVPLEFEAIYLGHTNLRFCRGCRVCFDRGEDKCPLKDDLLALKARVQTADGVIFATPVYVDDVSGSMKNWIDRMAHVCHRPQFMGKCAFLLATTGTSPTGHAIRTLGAAASSWGFHIPGQAGFKTGAIMPQADIESRYQKKTDQVAHTLLTAIYKRQYSRPGFVSLMTFRIQQWYYQRKTQESLDYRYWKGQGWTDSGREYYIHHQANRVKVTFARLTGSLLAKIMA
jgi:multimeric flavodoxin WrbA